MKKFILTTLVFLSILSFTSAKNPRILKSGQGYWVLEEHPHPKPVQIVKYYSPKHQLVRQDTVVGKRIDLNKRKWIVRLNRAVCNQKPI